LDIVELAKRNLW